MFENVPAIPQEEKTGSNTIFVKAVEFCFKNKKKKFC